MKIKTREEEGVFIIAVAGRMDAVSAPGFEKKCEEWIAKEKNAFIIDFSDLDYISSAGLRSLLVIGKKLKTKNGTMYLAALKDVIKDVFEISGFDSIFSIFESVKEALGQI